MKRNVLLMKDWLAITNKKLRNDAIPNGKDVDE